MIGLVTDSNAQVPADLVERWGLGVVPITVVVDGDARPETEIEPEGFYRRLDLGAQVTTSQPSPGEIARSWDAQVHEGATEIVSIHIGSEHSGTLNAARLATELVEVPVELVDTGQVSFGIGCAVWAAAEARSAGATAAEVAAEARAVAARVDNAFVMDGLGLFRAGGRLTGDATTSIPGRDGVVVYSMIDATLAEAGVAVDHDDAARLMVDAALSGDQRVRVAVGVADARLAPLGDALVAGVAGHPMVDAVVRYRVGPSVAAFTGAGSAGLYFFPVA